MSYPIVSRVDAVQAFYETMRDTGESHSIAEMLALQQSPRVSTDATFMEGHYNGNQFAHCPLIGNRYRARYKARMGRNPPNGHVYLSQLARFPGDPEAWISGKSDVKRVCEQRGWNCDGAVKVNAMQDEKPVKRIKLAEPLVKRHMAKYIKENPDRAKDMAGLREEVINRHGNPHVEA